MEPFIFSAYDARISSAFCSTASEIGNQMRGGIIREQISENGSPMDRKGNAPSLRAHILTFEFPI